MVGLDQQAQRLIPSASANSHVAMSSASARRLSTPASLLRAGVGEMGAPRAAPDSPSRRDLDVALGERRHLVEHDGGRRSLVLTPQSSRAGSRSPRRRCEHPRSRFPAARSERRSRGGATSTEVVVEETSGRLPPRARRGQTSRPRCHAPRTLIRIASTIRAAFSLGRSWGARQRAWLPLMRRDSRAFRSPEC